MICLRGITKTYEMGRYQPIEALRSIDLDIDRGEFVVITGRSGAGKTTLLNVIAGLATPTSGSVTLDGVDLWCLSDRRLSLLRNRTMGFVFQFPSLLASLSVLQNVMLPVSLASESGRRLPAASLRAARHGRAAGQVDVAPQAAVGGSAAAGGHRSRPYQSS